MHLVGVLYEIYHDARSHERKNSQPRLRVRYFNTFWHNNKVMYNSLYKELVSKTASPFCLGFARERVQKLFFLFQNFPEGNKTLCRRQHIARELRVQLVCVISFTHLRLGLPGGLFPAGPPHQNPVLIYIPPTPLTCHMARQYHLPLFVDPLAWGHTDYETSH